jgi:hypothetical protein
MLLYLWQVLPPMYLRNEEIRVVSQLQSDA